MVQHITRGCASRWAEHHKEGSALSEKSLTEVVRRVVAARVRDPHLVEDLTQETLLRVATIEHRLTVESRQAYAIVTARNVIADHARKDAVHRRHAHRIVEHTRLDGPERAVLDQEETAALVTGLQHLDDDDRDLLLRHDVDGASTADLAAAIPGASAGSVAMRLMRIRATLRLEFLLAYRRQTLPTRRCRPVLLALSTGDRRRQHTLRAGEHLRRCDTCADLARPLAERQRRLAGLLLLPFLAARRGVHAIRRSPKGQVAAALVAAGGLAAGLLASGAIDTDQTGQRRRPPPATTSLSLPTSQAPRIVTATPAPATPSRSTTTQPIPSTVPPTRAPTTAVSSTSTAPSTSGAPCPPPQPIDQIEPRDLIGCPIASTALTVISVPADEGFWAATLDGEPVWVQLTGIGESPITIEAGTTITVRGTLRPPPSAADDPALAAADYFLDVPFDGVTPS